MKLVLIHPGLMVNASLIESISSNTQGVLHVVMRSGRTYSLRPSDERTLESLAYEIMKEET